MHTHFHWSAVGRSLAAICLLSLLAGCGSDDATPAPPASSASTPATTPCKTTTPGLRCAP